MALDLLVQPSRSLILRTRPIPGSYFAVGPKPQAAARVVFMFRLSAFADEIDPDPQKQVDVLRQCGVRHLELRSILKTNVLDLTDLQVRELKSLLDRHGITLSAIGSPIGKIKIDEPFEPHLQRFR